MYLPEQKHVLGLQKYNYCASICIQNQFCGGLITFDRGVHSQLCTECTRYRTPDNTLSGQSPVGWVTIGQSGCIFFRTDYFTICPEVQPDNTSFPLETIKFSCFQLNLLVKAEKGDLSTFVTNGEWHLLGKEEEKNKRDDRLSCDAA